MRTGLLKLAVAVALILSGCAAGTGNTVLTEENQTTTEETNMEYRVESWEEFRVVGIVTQTTNEDNKGMQDVPAFWGETVSNNRQTDILPLMNQQPFGLLGINAYNTDSGDARKFNYYIACATDQAVPEGMAEYTVPAHTWAIFPCKQEEIGKVMVRIVTDWLPTSGYQLVNSGYETGYMEGGAPDLERYGEGDDVEIWVAVQQQKGE